MEGNKYTQPNDARDIRSNDCYSYLSAWKKGRKTIARLTIKRRLYGYIFLNCQLDNLWLLWRQADFQTDNPDCHKLDQYKVMRWRLKNVAIQTTVCDIVNRFSFRETVKRSCKLWVKIRAINLAPLGWWGKTQENSSFKIRILYIKILTRRWKLDKKSGLLPGTKRGTAVIATQNEVLVSTDVAFDESPLLSLFSPLLWGKLRGVSGSARQCQL